MTQVNIHIAKAHLSELIQRAMLGEEVIIARDNKPVVKLVAFSPLQKRQLGSAKDLADISPNFNESLEDFKDYME